MKATILKALFIAPFVGWMGCLWVPTPGHALFGRPYGQPAGQASAPSLFHVSAKGDHQAQGRGR
jgi:hypothetical protein